MKTSFLFLASALLFSTAASAQSFITVPDEQELLGVPSPKLAPPHPTTVAYFGAYNSSNVSDLNFSALRQAFEVSRPTVVFYQGPDLGTSRTEAASIRQYGAGGCVRFLAQQTQATALRLDDPTAEYAYLRTRIAPEPLKLYYLLSALQQRQRSGLSPRLLVPAMQELLANSDQFLPGTSQVIRNLDELTAAYHTYCPAGGQWQQARAAWFGPTAAPTRSASFDEVNQAIGDYRRQALHQQLAQQGGQRVLVVTQPGYLPAGLNESAVAGR